jgi:hypothetical protein
MKSKKLWTLLLVVGCSCTALFAQKKVAEQWVNLFNGKDLEGWKQLNGKAKYEVKNGEIIGTTVLNEPNSFLATEKNYSDFIFEVEFKVNSTMNSGIQFRSEINDAADKCTVTDKTTPERVHGYQMEIDPSTRAWSGGIYDEARRGWLYSLENNPAAKPAFKNDHWNHYRIECIGNSIRTWVNGIACAHLVDEMTTTGFIALQVHSIGNNPKDVGKEIRWRNVRIQTINLKPSPADHIFVINTIPNTISEDEKKSGMRLLWDGKTTNGWRGAYKTYFPDKTWYIEDGTLNVRGGAGAESSNGGDIVTTEEFSAFDLQFEFKLTDTANSGVKYFVTEKEDTHGSAIGLEYQILDDDHHPDAKLGSIGNRTQASLYDLIPSLKITESRREKLPVGEWNRGRVVVFPDGRVEHWINGWKVVEYQRGTQYFYALVAKSKYEKWPGFGMAPKGRILLQEHGTHVSFRSIKIREL